MFLEGRIIVLRTIKYGEADLIVQGISESGSGFSFMARGAKKSRKRFSGGVLEPTHFIKVTYRDKKGEKSLYELSEATLLEGFSGLRSSYERMQASLFFLKIVNKVSGQGLVDSRGVFLLLGQTLRALEKSNSIYNLKIHFLSHLLAEQGVFPENQNSYLLDQSIEQHEGIDCVQKKKWASYVQLTVLSAQAYLGMETLLAPLSRP